MSQQEVVFDENGKTIQTMEATEVDESVEESTEAPEEHEEQSETPTPMGKYKIGDKVFQTQEEALAYAQTQVSAIESEKLLADAYRRGIEDAAQLTPQAAPDVTQPPDPLGGLNPEDIYVNPSEFLAKFAEKIKSETRAELDHKDRIKAESDQIWGEFVTRHPMLADFRKEVEDFANQNLSDVRAIIATKGRPAGYDYVATKLKSRFESYANAVKPKRELPNTRQAASPSGVAADVTPKQTSKKALSFSEQIKMLRKKR